MLKIFLISLYFISCSNEQNSKTNKKQEVQKKDIKNIENKAYDLNKVAEIVSSGNLNIIKQTINSQNVNVENENNWMFLPLYIAISKGNKEVVEFLLSIKGINVNARVEGDRKSILTSAILYCKNNYSSDRLEIIKLLVQNGAIIYYPNERNVFMQPLYYAFSSEIGRTYKSNFDILEILLNKTIEFLKNDSEVEVINSFMGLIERRYTYNAIPNLIPELNEEEKEKLDKIVQLFLDKFSKTNKFSNLMKTKIVFYQRASLLQYLIDNNIQISSKIVQNLEKGFKFDFHYNQNFKEPLRNFIKQLREKNLIIEE